MSEKRYVEVVNSDIGSNIFICEQDLISKSDLLKEWGIDLLQVNLTALYTAHRACCGSEANPLVGKFHGYCVVCGVPFPCEIAKGLKPDKIMELLKGGE